MSKNINILGANVYYQVAGTEAGEPALFLHGVPDSGDMWNPLIARLGSQLRAVAPDLPGLGRSTALADFDLSLENMARFVESFRLTAGLTEPVHLFAHDFGGHYGLAWAVRHPEAVRSITIFNTSFFTSYRWHPNAQIYRVPLLGELTLRAINFNMFRKVVQNISPALTTEYLRGVFEMSYTKPSVRRMILRLYRERNPVVDFAGWETELRELNARIPSAVMWGDRDPFAASNFAEQFGAQHVYHFSDYGHWLPLEGPAAVAEKWLATVNATK
ncbi:MAG: alpha/beta hydrolase [Anaerolineae bacterium]